MQLKPLSAPKTYVQTPTGNVVNFIPELIQDGYDLAGIATILCGRLNAEKKVRDDWNPYFWTGDSSAVDNTGAAVLTLNSPFLRELNAEGPLVNCALALDDKMWKTLKADKNSLYLTPDKVHEANCKGYVQQNGGVFVPANKTVEEVWDFLSQGQDMKESAQLVSEASGKSTNVMQLYFDLSEPRHPQLRSLVLNSFVSNSDVYGDSNLDSNYGRLAGVVSKPVLTSFGQVSGGVFQNE